MMRQRSPTCVRGASSDAGGLAGLRLIGGSRLRASVCVIMPRLGDWGERLAPHRRSSQGGLIPGGSASLARGFLSVIGLDLRITRRRELGSGPLGAVQ